MQTTCRRALIVLRGNSGSGKSVTAKALQRHFGRGTLMIPQDTVRREMLWARDGEGTPALPLLQSLLRYGHGHCAVTILEGILASDVYAPLFAEAARLYGSHLYAYYWDIPFEETLCRHATKPNRGDFGEADMRRWWREKDYAPMLREKRLDETLSQEGALHLILSDMAQRGDA